MKITLQNTLKNATQPLLNNQNKLNQKPIKSVSFKEQSNIYYDPPLQRMSCSQ
jgi:hypothetical protein